MPTRTTYPRINAVEARPAKTLFVRFDNGAGRIYDCTPLLADDAFRPLEDEAVFRLAHADAHGYAVIWNEDIDLAESEIWLNGRPVDDPAQPDE